MKGEAVMPGLTDFLLYCAYNQNYKYRYLSGRKSAQVLGNIAKDNRVFQKDIPGGTISQQTLLRAGDHPKHCKRSGNSTGSDTRPGKASLTGEMVELIKKGLRI